jgi:acyl-CoA thioesterase FadM
METPNVPASTSIRFVAQLRTRWSDEDNHGELNNAVYLTLFEEARHAYFSELGAMQGNFFPFVLGQTNVVYLKSGRGGAAVEVEVVTTHVGGSSLTQSYRVKGPGGEVWCEAEARLVFTERDESTGNVGKAQVPDSVRAAIAALEQG